MPFLENDYDSLAASAVTDTEGGVKKKKKRGEQSCGQSQSET